MKKLRKKSPLSGIVILFLTIYLFTLFPYRIVYTQETDALFIRKYGAIDFNKNYLAQQTSNGVYFIDNFLSNEYSKQSKVKPPLDAGRITDEILAGLGLGTLTGGIGTLMGINICDDPSSFISDCVIYSFVITYSIGSATGVYLIGNIGDETGSFVVTLCSSLIGGALGFLAGGAPVLLCAPIGATIGFNTTRRYKTPCPSEMGFINIKDGKMSLSAPSIHFSTYLFDKRAIIQNIDIVKVTF